MIKCKFCGSEMTEIIREDDYEQWDCRGGDHLGQFPVGCSAFLERRKENGWKDEWKRKEDR